MLHCKKQQDKFSFSNLYLKTFKIKGRQLIDAVIGEYNSNEIMLRNACSLLGISRVAKFDTYEHKWDRYL
jgi:hypothetical protein